MPLLKYPFLFLYIGLVVYITFFNKKRINTSIKSTLQSLSLALILFGILVTAGLYLQSQKLVAWWNLLILVALLILVEIYFIYLSKDKKKDMRDANSNENAESNVQTRRVRRVRRI